MRTQETLGGRVSAKSLLTSAKTNTESQRRQSKRRESQTIVGLAVAALPQHIAVSLRLTVRPTKELRRLRLRFSIEEAQPRGKKKEPRPVSRRAYRYVLRESHQTAHGVGIAFALALSLRSLSFFSASRSFIIT